MEGGRERRGDWQQPSPSGRRVAGNISPVKFVDPAHRNSVAARQRAAAAASPASCFAAPAAATHSGSAVIKQGPFPPYCLSTSISIPILGGCLTTHTEVTRSQ